MLKLNIRLFYIKNRNQTTTCCDSCCYDNRLFYIKNRNQTTTDKQVTARPPRLFYIKNRNQTTTDITNIKEIKKLFYIKNRNQTTTDDYENLRERHYFTSKIEIKPQLTKSKSREYSIILHQK